MGIATPPQEIQPEAWEVLMALAGRAAEVLEDHRLQSEMFSAMEGLLPGMTTSQWIRSAARTGDLSTLTGEPPAVPPDFAQRVKDALAHYWGGPKLTDQAFMGLSVVRRALEEHDGNPQRAMRAVLQEAIERQRPDGQRSMTTTEWIFYNILEMRFIQGRKVRDVAMRLAMSESDLYRKQRGAIEAVAQAILDMESATATKVPGNGMREGVS
jgi:hypothetical protein